MSAKATLEALKGLQDLVSDYKKVMADGKVDMNDISVLQDLFNQMGEISSAVKDAHDIPAEIKDISDEDAAAVAVAALAVVKAFKG
jgi:hypothetical protein